MFKLMIVDDEPNVVEGIRDSIDWEQYGATVVAVAYDGEQALELCARVRPDIIIADIKMPELSGLEMTARAKQMLPDARFILISAFEQFDYAREAIALEVQAYLTKPVKPSEIIDAVLKTIRKLKKDRTLLPEANADDLYEEVSHDVILEATNYIEKFQYKELTLADVAAHVALSTSYFSRLFKKETGMLFVDYMKHKKIERAKRLLLRTNKKVYAISQELGYQSVQYFATMFKAMEGMTPSQYRYWNKYRNGAAEKSNHKEIDGGYRND